MKYRRSLFPFALFIALLCLTQTNRRIEATGLFGSEEVAPGGDARALAPAQVTPLNAQPLTHAQARQRALAANLELAALAAEVEAAGGRFSESRALANPDFTYEVENFGGGRQLGEIRETTIGLTLPIEFPGKRHWRVLAYTSALKMSEQGLAVRRLDLFVQVDRAFATLLGAQEHLALAEESVRTASEVEAAVTAMVEAGAVSPIEQTRAEVETAISRLSNISAQQEIATARRDMARLLGQENADFAAAVGDLASLARIEEDALAQEMADDLPDLARQDAQISLRLAESKSARLAIFPDLSLSVGRRSFPDSTSKAWVASVGFTLPLFNRHRGAGVEAKAHLQQGRLERQAVAVQLHTELANARSALAAAENSSTLLVKDILPRAEQVLIAMSEGYRNGKFRLLDVLEARRFLIAARMQVVDALVQSATAAADVKRLTSANMKGQEP